jgi:hypothetical protein
MDWTRRSISARRAACSRRRAPGDAAVIGVDGERGAGVLGPDELGVAVGGGGGGVA